MNIIEDRSDGKWSQEPCFVSRFSDMFKGVLCTICSKELTGGDAVQDRFIFEPDGGLDYIELAHAECVCKEAHGCSFCDYDEERNHCHTLS